MVVHLVYLWAVLRALYWAGPWVVRLVHSKAVMKELCWVEMRVDWRAGPRVGQRAYARADSWVAAWVVCWAGLWAVGMAKWMVARLAQSRAVLRVSLLAGSTVFAMVEL